MQPLSALCGNFVPKEKMDTNVGTNVGPLVSITDLVLSEREQEMIALYVRQTCIMCISW